MTIRAAAEPNLALSTAITLGLFLWGGAAIAADAPIYKCVQANGAVLYADFPCNGGAALDIHPGVADPAATERLQRAQAELDRAAARRRADEAVAANRAAEHLRYDVAVPRGVPEPDMNYPDATYGLVLGGYGRSVHRRPVPSASPKRLEHRRFEPGPSLRVGRDQSLSMGSGNRPRGGD